MNTKWPNLHLEHPPGTLWLRSLETRCCTHSEESLQHHALLLHHTPHFPLRPHVSRSKLSCSKIFPTVQPSNTATNTPSNGNSTCNGYHRIENTSLFALRCFYICQTGMSTRKLKIYTIDDSKYCTKTKWNTMITAPRRHKHPSSGANRPSDIAVTVNINAQFNLMAVNPIIEYFSRDLVPEYCQGLESSAVYTAPPFFVETLSGRWNKNKPRLPLHMHVQGTNPACLMSNIYTR